MPALPALALLLPLVFTHAAAQAARCEARSSTTPPQIVELYTSEGCSSCPPADRWLSGLKGRSDVIALAYHVNYWDRLGWPDRFATPEFTARQHDLASRNGLSYVYTPQVVVDGEDWRSWPRLPKPAKRSAVEVVLVREGPNVVATVAPTSAAPSLAGFWAVLEDNHSSKVRAGENAGTTLAHDHVVRLHRELPPWPAAEGTKVTLAVSAGVPEHPRRVAFVITDRGRPVHGVVLACGASG